METIEASIIRVQDLDQKYAPFEWIYQQDGARSHTSGASIECLE
jgi:hypothetical protein